jgi:dCTP deaminase
MINVTPFEPEWEGYATLSISNLSPCPVRLYAGEGVAQLLFLQADEICSISYRDKNGKYQAQLEPTTAKA